MTYFDATKSKNRNDFYNKLLFFPTILTHYCNEYLSIIKLYNTYTCIEFQNYYVCNTVCSLGMNYNNYYTFVNEIYFYAKCHVNIKASMESLKKRLQSVIQCYQSVRKWILQWSIIWFPLGYKNIGICATIHVDILDMV